MRALTKGFNGNSYRCFNRLLIVFRRDLRCFTLKKAYIIYLKKLYD